MAMLIFYAIMYSQWSSWSGPPNPIDAMQMQSTSTMKNAEEAERQSGDNWKFAAKIALPTLAGLALVFGLANVRKRGYPIPKDKLNK